MNWAHFLLWTLGIYFLYYLSMILYDLTAAQKTGQTPFQELSFSEHVLPQQIEHLPIAAERNHLKPAMISSGGVSLKELFGLCKDEAVLFTRPVSF